MTITIDFPNIIAWMRSLFVYSRAQWWFVPVVSIGTIILSPVIIQVVQKVACCIFLLIRRYMIFAFNINTESNDELDFISAITLVIIFFAIIISVLLVGV